MRDEDLFLVVMPMRWEFKSAGASFFKVIRHNS